MIVPGVKIIRVGKIQVGLVGLEEAFKKVRRASPGSDKKTADMLLSEIKQNNYVSPASEEGYRKALLRDYKKYFGEPVEIEETSEGLTIRILGPGCPACDRMEKTVREVLVELALEADLEHIDDSSEIEKAGIIGTPALLVNGKVKSIGKIPSRNKIKEWLLKENK